MADLLLHLCLLAWLLPCALQDWRSRHVSNWLTLPAFVLAWPLSLWLGGEERLVFTFALFVGCWFAWQMEGMGAADGKIATALAALLPQAVLWSGGLLFLCFVGLRLRRQQQSVPAVVVLFLGAFLSSFVRERPAAAPAQKGVYWRDRYIEYAPPSPGLKGRIRRFFRR